MRLNRYYRGMGTSRPLVLVSSVVAIVAAIATTLLWTGIVALAGPAFDSATLAATRVEESRVLGGDIDSVTFIPIPNAVADNSPKLKEVLRGADEKFEILSNSVGYSVPVNDVYKLGISEGELNTLLTSLPATNSRQLVNNEKYVSTYHSLNLQYDGKYYLVTITEVGTQ